MLLQALHGILRSYGIFVFSIRSDIHVPVIALQSQGQMQ